MVAQNRATFQVAALFLLVGFFAGPGFSAEPKQGWENMVAEARREGRVVIYGSGGIDRVRLYKDRFEAVFPGIRVEYLAMGAGEITMRIMAERRAGKFISDISLGGAGGTTVTPLRSHNALQPIYPVLLLPEVLERSRWFENKLWFMDRERRYVLTYALTPGTIAAYNTNLVNPKEIISYRDLLNPRWRGKLVSSDIRVSGGPGGGTVKFIYAHPELGPDYLRSLFGDMNVTLSRDHRQMIDWLGRGRFSFVLFTGLDSVDKAREQGLPVNVLDLQQMKEGYPLTSGWNSIILLNPAPHPNAAAVFINWLLSREAQSAFEEIMGIASLRVDTPTKAGLRDFLIPRKNRYMVVSEEKYWELDPEIKALIAGLIK